MSIAHAIDRVLWRFVASRMVFLEQLVVLSLGVPLLVATAIPRGGRPTDGWPLVYVGVVAVCAIVSGAVSASRERWLSWSQVVREEERRRRDQERLAAASRARVMIDHLVLRDRTWGR